MSYQSFQKVLNNNLPKEKGLVIKKYQFEHYKNLSHVVLGILGGLGAVGLSFIAPNLMIALKPFIKARRKNFIKDRTDNKVLAETLTYLKRHGLIKMRPKEGDFEVKITDIGEKTLLNANFNNLQVQNSTGKWDGLWWQVAADIPTMTHRTAADMFRRKLKQMGFCALQKSLWFYPFDPRRELQFICEHYGIEQYVTVMEISRMDEDDEGKLFEHFKTKKIV